MNTGSGSRAWRVSRGTKDMIAQINMQTIAAFGNWASTCLPTRAAMNGGSFEFRKIESMLTPNIIRSIGWGMDQLGLPAACTIERTLSLISKSDI